MLSLRGSIFVSGCVHVGIFFAFLLISRPGGAKILYKPQYQVRLVQPDEVPSLSKPKPKPVPIPKPSPVKTPPKSKVALPEKKEAPKEKPEKKPPVPEKKEVQKPKPVVKPETHPPKKSKEAAEKKTKETPPPQPVRQAAPAPEPEPQKVLDDVLARIKKKVGAQQKVAANRQPSPDSGWEQRQKQMAYNKYYDLVDQRVYENWIPPPGMDLGKQDLTAVVALTMLPDGRILKSYIEESSGDPLFDQSVMRAILKSNPLPPPPIGLDQQSYELGLNFYSSPRSR